MEGIIKDSINYLNTTNDTNWDIFTNSNIKFCDHKVIKKYLLAIQKDLLNSTNKMKLFTFPMIRIRSNCYDMETIEPFFSYFNVEKACLLLLRKLSQSNITILDDFSNYQIAGILLHTIGNTHSTNQKHLISLLQMINTLNDGIQVYLDEEQIQPINHQLVKRMNTTVNQHLMQKKRTFKKE